MERLMLLEQLLEPIPSAITSLTMTSISSAMEVVKLEEGKEFEDGSTCVCCNLLFKDETKLRNHLENKRIQILALSRKGKVLTKHKHGNIKCYLCDKEFSSQGNLKRHQDIHRNIKRYECDLCLQRFRRKDGMKTHRKLEVQANTKAAFRRYTKPTG